MTDRLHASCVEIGDQGVLILGASGSGKSSLAWRLIDEQGAKLVGDDQLYVWAEDHHLYVRPALPGLIEMHGIGVIECVHTAQARLSLVINLDQAPQRVAESQHHLLCGLKIPCLGLSAHDTLAPLRVAMALRTIGVTGFSSTGLYRDER